LMQIITTILLLGACLLAAPTGLRAQAADAGADEAAAFTAAARSFQDQNWITAEQWLGDFLKNFPLSTRRAEATLLFAQSRFKQRNYAGCIEALSVDLGRAGGRAEEYLFWLAEAQFYKGDFRAAAAAYAKLLQTVPNSKRALEVSVSEALAHARAGDWAQVVELLQPAGGRFQRLMKAAPNAEGAMRGQLLLAEALFERAETKASELSLASLAQRKLDPELAWRRQHLQMRLQLATGRAAQALAETFVLFELATVSQQPRLVAETFRLRGDILERLDRLPEAVQVHEKNLAAGMPEEHRRAALLKILDLTLRQGQTAEVIGRLESFIKENAQDAALDVAEFTLGELRLREFRALIGPRADLPGPPEIAAETNLLAAAQARFERVLREMTNSTYTGQAHLNRGWCLWYGGRTAESQADFAAAARILPVSKDQAWARLKLGEAQFLHKDYTNALGTFRALVHDYEKETAFPRPFFDQIHFKSLRAAIEIGDLSQATAAMGRILTGHPDGLLGGKGMLLVGQAMNRLGKPAEARALIADFLRRFPASPLAPEAHLAVARTHVQEKDWPAAIAAYERWLKQFGGHPVQAQVELDRAWTFSMSGRETNAFTAFTNLVARFPAAPQAPLAQLWVADHHFNRGDFVGAEKCYQVLAQSTNCPPDLHFSSRMMAGRASLARQGFADARRYFAELFDDKNCPDAVKAEAVFALGDATILEFSTASVKPKAKYEEAINAFTRLQQLFPTNPVAAQAWGRIGDCHLQLASEDPARYEKALLAYQKVMQMESRVAGVAARSQAEAGVALVFEREAEKKLAAERAALVEKALGHYLGVFYGKNLRPNEQQDPFWMKEAGLAAARLCEGQMQWAEAVAIYRRLQEAFPALRPALQKKIDRALEQLGRAEVTAG
jgi:TolA-binding protein